MKQQYYKDMAKLLAQLRYDMEQATVQTPTYAETMQAYLKHELHVLELLSSENPNFQRAKFVSACAASYHELLGATLTA
jgi:hypothetical protein